MRFESEGTFHVTIRDAFLGEPKFAKAPDCDVCIEVADEAGHSDWWRGEVSQSYGKGNMSDRRQCEITDLTLQRLGLDSGLTVRLGEELQKFRTSGQCDGAFIERFNGMLKGLVGKTTSAFVKASEKDGKVYHNIRGLGEFESDVKPLNLAALFGAKPAAASQTPASAAPGKENPFARR